MPPVFSLTVMAPESTIFRGKARGLVAPGSDGYLGVLAHHAPMVSVLAIGRLEILNEAGERQFFALSGGVLETGGNQVTILADCAEPSEDIDVSRAEAAEQRARDRLVRNGSDLDVARAQAALARALNRQRVARDGHA